MAIDIAALASNLAPQFTTGRTGQGAAAEWSVVADPTAAEGRALAQVSTDRTSYRFPLAIYEPYNRKVMELCHTMPEPAQTGRITAKGTATCSRC